MDMKQFSSMYKVQELSDIWMKFSFFLIAQGLEHDFQDFCTIF